MCGGASNGDGLPPYAQVPGSTSTNVIVRAAASAESMLFGLKGTDTAAIGAALVILLAVAHLAAWLPARRAARVDPLIALRSE